MTRQRHEIPTHLNVEDKAFLGLSIRQVLCLVSGLSASYALWNQWPDLPVGPRLGLALANLLVTLAFALIRLGGRGMEEWAFVALHYAATPKTSRWQPREPRPADWRPARTAWAELTPRLTWQPLPTGARGEVRR